MKYPTVQLCRNLFFFSVFQLKRQNLAAVLYVKNKQEFRGTPRCTGSQIVDFGINLSKIFSDRNMVKVTKRVPYHRGHSFQSIDQSIDGERERERRERERERDASDSDVRKSIRIYTFRPSFFAWSCTIKWGAKLHNYPWNHWINGTGTWKSCTRKWGAQISMALISVEHCIYQVRTYIQYIDTYLHLPTYRQTDTHDIYIGNF